MKHIVREKPNFFPMINGFEFEPCEAGSVSVVMSDEEAEQFLNVPGYRVAEDNEVPTHMKEEKKETAAEKKARLNAEKAAKKEAEAAKKKSAADAPEKKEVAETDEAKKEDGESQSAAEQTDTETAGDTGEVF